jgi:hypothetical protein
MPTVWRIIPSLEFLIKRWETMATHPQYRNVRDAINEGVQSFKSGTERSTIHPTHISYVLVRAFLFVSNICPLIVLLVLDPTVKDRYCHHLWETEQFDAGMRRLEEVVRRYL